MAGVAHLVLTHLDPDNDAGISLAETESTFPGSISLAAPGRVLDLDL
jgi:ribonuclease BN (tRNA processing enzyme)